MSSLKKYLAKLNETERLSTKEINKLTKESAAGDKKAQEKLAAHFGHDVLRLAMEFRSRGLVENLVDEGNQAAKRAIQEYQPGSKETLETCVLRAITDAMRVLSYR